MLAWDDQHASFFPQSLDKLERADVEVITQVGDRARVRRNERELVGVSPVCQNRIVGIQDVPRPREQPRAIFRAQRDSREQVARGSGTDRRVVVIRPGLGYKLGRRSYPANSQTRKSVSLR